MVQLRSTDFSIFFIIHVCLPQERRQSVAGGKVEKRGPRHAPSWTLRTRTGPRFFLSISCPRSNTSRDTHSPFFSPFSSLSLFLSLLLSLSLAAATSGSFDYHVWLSAYQLFLLSSLRHSGFTGAIYLNETRMWLPMCRGLIDLPRQTGGHATMCTRTYPIVIPSVERSKATPVLNADWTTGEAMGVAPYRVLRFPLAALNPYDRPSRSLYSSSLLFFHLALPPTFLLLLSPFHARALSFLVTLPRSAYNLR